MSKLNFAFIVGAPRCGTTFIARHLRNHPNVCFSLVKEPHFFSARDLRALPQAELEKVIEREYLDRYFPHRRPDSLLVEGSVTYLYTPGQLEPVLQMWPDAKFIVAVRDPMHMVPSLHQRLRCIGDETVANFNRAWGLVQDRRQGRDIPRRCADPRWLDYWESGRLGHYVDEFFRTIGRERCFVSVFDDLKSDPADQYRRILEFLSLPDDGQSDFEPARQSSGFKYQWLQHLLKRPPRAAISLLGSEATQIRTSTAPRGRKGALARAILGARSRLLEWNKQPSPPVQLSASVSAHMRSMFEDDVRLLSATISRDLSHWLNRSSAGRERP
jgi:hypothetical protein